MSKPKDDRKQLWKKMFPNEPMPQIEKGAVRKYAGSLDKRISGEALSQKRFEEEIRKHAKTFSQWIRRNAELFNAGKYKESSEFGQQLLVSVDVVLGVVAQQDAKNEEIRVALAKTCTKLNDQIGRLERAEAERNQKLAEWVRKNEDKAFFMFIKTRNPRNFINTDDIKELKALLSAGCEK